MGLQVLVSTIMVVISIRDVYIDPGTYVICTTSWMICVLRIDTILNLWYKNTKMSVGQTVISTDFVFTDNLGLRKSFLQ